MEFTPIETQEALDALLSAERDKFKGYISPEELKKQTGELSGQLAEKDKKIAELESKNKAFELSALKAKIARENGLRPELAERLTGEDEKALKADAKALAELVSPANPAPLRSGEDMGSGAGAATSNSDAAYMTMLSELNN